MAIPVLTWVAEMILTVLSKVVRSDLQISPVWRHFPYQNVSSEDWNHEWSQRQSVIETVSPQSTLNGLATCNLGPEGCKMQETRDHAEFRSKHDLHFSGTTSVSRKCDEFASRRECMTSSVKKRQSQDGHPLFDFLALRQCSQEVTHLSWLRCDPLLRSYDVLLGVL